MKRLTIIALFITTLLLPAKAFLSETLDQTILDGSSDPEFSQYNDVGSDIKILLKQLESLNIDVMFFKNPPFTLLVDFSVNVPQRPTGVRNPFLPLDVSLPWKFKNTQ